MPYEVSTPVYEGPFDLLLHLIAKEQVNLFDVSIARIVNAFLDELARMRQLDLDVATEFLLIASTLVELKLRKLLPDRASVDMEEELALLEERDLLLAKLLEYQTFRRAAEALSQLEAEAGRSFARTNVVEDRFANLAPDPLDTTTPAQLRAAFARLLNRRFLAKPEPKVTLGHVTDVRITVADAVGELARMLPGVGRTSFRSLFDDDAVPMEVIVRFLAVLELYKQGWIEIDQSTNFGELSLEWVADGLRVLDVGADAGALRQVVPLTAVDADRSLADRSLADRSLDDVEDEALDDELDRALAVAAAQRLAGGIAEVGDSVAAELGDVARSDVAGAGVAGAGAAGFDVSEFEIDDYEG